MKIVRLRVICNSMSQTCAGVHEQLDPVGLIHMNGRVYDPELGRFLSPDIAIQDIFQKAASIGRQPEALMVVGGPASRWAAKAMA